MFSKIVLSLLAEISVVAQCAMREHSAKTSASARQKRRLVAVFIGPQNPAHSVTGRRTAAHFFPRGSIGYHLAERRTCYF
jgi:hypothetical protein